MFRQHLATSSSASLSQTCTKVQNSFAFIMVSGQLIYFHLAISKELLIYLDHLRISRSPAKKTLGVLLPTELSPTRGWWCVPESEGDCQSIVRLLKGRDMFSQAQPGLDLPSAYLDYCQSGDRLRLGEFSSRKC